jgi:hypothetical protein
MRSVISDPTGSEWMIGKSESYPVIAKLKSRLSSLKTDFE